MKIEKLGKLIGQNGFFFKVTLDKEEEIFCECCGKMKSKTYYFNHENESNKGGVKWCENCATTFNYKKAKQ